MLSIPFSLALVWLNWIEQLQFLLQQTPLFTDISLCGKNLSSPTLSFRSAPRNSSSFYLIGAPRKLSLRGAYHWSRFHFYRVVVVLEVAIHMRRAKKKKGGSPSQRITNKLAQPKIKIVIPWSTTTRTHLRQPYASRGNSKTRA